MDLQECIKSIAEYAVYDIVNEYAPAFFNDVAYEISEYADDEDELENNVNDADYITSMLYDVVQYALGSDIDVDDMYMRYADNMCIYSNKCNEILDGVGMSTIRLAASELGYDVNTASECELAFSVLVLNLPSTDIVDDVVDYIVENYDIVKEVKEYME